MGVTISYRGSLADMDRVEDFEDRVLDVALEIGGHAQVWRSSAGSAISVLHSATASQLAFAACRVLPPWSHRSALNKVHSRQEDIQEAEVDVFPFQATKLVVQLIGIAFFEIRRTLDPQTSQLLCDRRPDVRELLQLDREIPRKSALLLVLVHSGVARSFLLCRSRFEMSGSRPVSRDNSRTRLDKTKWPRHTTNSRDRRPDSQSFPRESWSARTPPRSRAPGPAAFEP